MIGLDHYLLQHTVKQEKWMNKLEHYAKKNHVPIMERVSMQFLAQLVLIHQPKRILEVGTAIGYSTLRIHDVLPSAKIVSIERNEKMFHLAKQHIHEYRQQDTINLILGDGITELEQLKKSDIQFDFIFIDAAKSQYKNFFVMSKKLLNDKGMIVCDNVLFREYVFKETENIPKRFQKISNKLNQFNLWLMEQNDFFTTIVPVGDGLSISVKK